MLKNIFLIHGEKTASSRKVVLQKEADNTRGIKEDVIIREMENIKIIYAQNIRETVETSWTKNVE